MCGTLYPYDTMTVIRKKIDIRSMCRSRCASNVGMWLLSEFFSFIYIAFEESVVYTTHIGCMTWFFDSVCNIWISAINFSYNIRGQHLDTFCEINRNAIVYFRRLRCLLFLFQKVQILFLRFRNVWHPRKNGGTAYTEMFGLMSKTCRGVVAVFFHW